ncbi:uncharacterized protein L969DRAFT_221398 [Mixia osmundae IAM 14324]|uniref:uncharacterized protein n=1 Tax=Mixia osmundae (strain CBS 9802 / IAM 14324 / JCM 22182 / KY 12970) TaxID=764103 RepID=UPI0004A5526A|nr:uncharacterized protein L969DRAFT_221398 [Mixia osmundae IAM 14324]KEI37192.1 hypothetical protein L969DRAFT_221398 [Mixia osmundae IAM 14324]
MARAEARRSKREEDRAFRLVFRDDVSSETHCFASPSRAHPVQLATLLARKATLLDREHAQLSRWRHHSAQSASDGLAPTDDDDDSDGLPSDTDGEPSRRAKRAQSPVRRESVYYDESEVDLTASPTSTLVSLSPERAFSSKQKLFDLEPITPVTPQLQSRRSSGFVGYFGDSQPRRRAPTVDDIDQLAGLVIANQDRYSLAKHVDVALSMALPRHATRCLSESLDAHEDDDEEEPRLVTATSKSMVNLRPRRSETDVPTLYRTLSMGDLQLQHDDDETDDDDHGSDEDDE